MKKILFASLSFVIALFCSGFFFSHPVLAATGDQNGTSTPADTVSPDVYQSVVKVKNYVINNNGALELHDEGSGIILSSTGLVLTNDHVVSMRSGYDDSDYATAYQICVTKDINLEPSCDYLAKLVARNKDKDVALLQIVNYPGSSESLNFPYLNLNTDDSITLNDKVLAVGYPAIGGETITVTSGVVSGKADKYNNQWIKTDAAVAFGSSGGAALNAKNEVIGITTQVNSDVSGDLGYVLSSISIGDWISVNMINKPQAGSLFDRLGALTRKQKILEKSNKFINLYPYFSLDKPASWSFQHDSEDEVTITDKDDQDGGSVSVHMIKAPFILDKNSVKPILARYFNDAGMSSVLKLNKELDVKVNGVAGKLFTFSAGGQSVNIYAIPHKEYLILITYNYGKNGKDKKSVDGIINSFKVTGVGSKLVETHKFINTSPKFSLTTDANWPIQTQDNKPNPIRLQNKTVKEAFVLFNLEKLDESNKNWTANEFIKAKKDEINSGNQASAAMDYKAVLNKTGSNFKINNTVKAFYYIDYTEKTVSDNKILAFDREYYIKIGDTMLTINLTVFTDKQAVFNKAVVEFNKMLKGLALK